MRSNDFLVNFPDDVQLLVTGNHSFDIQGTMDLSLIPFGPDNIENVVNGTLAAISKPAVRQTKDIDLIFNGGCDGLYNWDGSAWRKIDLIQLQNRPLNRVVQDTLDANLFNDKKTTFYLVPHH